MNPDCDMDIDMVVVRPSVEEPWRSAGAEVWFYTDRNGRLLDGIPYLSRTRTGSWRGHFNHQRFTTDEGRRDQIEALIEEALIAHGYAIVDTALAGYSGGDVDGEDA